MAGRWVLTGTQLLHRARGAPTDLRVLCINLLKYDLVWFESRISQTLTRPGI